MVYRGELKPIRVKGTLRFNPRDVRAHLIEHCGWEA